MAYSSTRSLSTDKDSGNIVEVLSTNGALHAHLVTTLAGETSSTTPNNNYLVISDKSNLTVISKTTTVTIGGGAAADVRLFGIEFVAALTGTCVISGFYDSDLAAQSITYPASTAAGFKNFHGAVNLAGALTFTVSNAADDNLVLVFWRPI